MDFLCGSGIGNMNSEPSGGQFNSHKVVKSAESTLPFSVPLPGHKGGLPEEAEFCRWWRHGTVDFVMHERKKRPKNNH